MPAKERYISQVVISPDSQYIATLYYLDKNDRLNCKCIVDVYHMNDGRLIKHYSDKVFRFAQSHLCFTTDSRYLLCLYDNRIVRRSVLGDEKTTLCTINKKAGYRAIVPLKDGNRYVLVDTNTIGLLSFEKGKSVIRVLTLPNEVADVFNTDAGEILFTCFNEIKNTEDCGFGVYKTSADFKKAKKLCEVFPDPSSNNQTIPNMVFDVCVNATGKRVFFRHDTEMKFSIRSYSLTDGMIAEYVPPSNVDRIKDLHLNETSSGPVVFFSERNQNYFADHFFSDVLEILNPDTLETQVRIKLDESLGTQFSISPDGKKAAIWLLCRWYKADLICKVPNEIFVDEEPDNAPLMNTRLASLWFISDDIEVECRFIMNIRLEICSRVTVMILTLSYSSSSPSET